MATMNNKKAVAIIRIIGGLTAVSGLVYGSYVGKAGYLFASIGFCMIVVSSILNSRAAVSAKNNHQANF